LLRKAHHLSKDSGLQDVGAEIKLDRPTAYPADLFGPLQEGFFRIYKPGSLYRQTGVVLAGLMPETAIQYTLFDDSTKIEKMSRIYSTVDSLSENSGNTQSIMLRACLQNNRPARGRKRRCPGQDEGCV